MLGGELTIHMAIRRAINAEIWGEKGNVRRGRIYRTCEALATHRACAVCAHTSNIKHAQGMHIGSIKRAQKCVIIEKGADAKCIRAMLK